MNKKGFTLVELLVTIIIIGVIMGIVFPSAIKISNESKGKMLEEYRKVVVEYALISPLKGQQQININDLDIPGKIKQECTGHANLISSNPIQYEAIIQCNN